MRILRSRLRSWMTRLLERVREGQLVMHAALVKLSGTVPALEQFHKGDWNGMFQSVTNLTNHG